jgi:non-specific serine/threonine protein kinase
MRASRSLKAAAPAPDLPSTRAGGADLYKGKSPKFEVLLETLETLQAENHKALVFSQFVETLKLREKETEEAQDQVRLSRRADQNRQARVDVFQNDPSYPFFLISLKAGGVGLNLTAADYVIHLDPWWNPAVEMQAADRAHRIGQDKPVFIYKIIARDTVEEKILELQRARCVAPAPYRSTV